MVLVTDVQQNDLFPGVAGLPGLAFATNLLSLLHLVGLLFFLNLLAFNCGRVFCLVFKFRSITSKRGGMQKNVCETGARKTSRLLEET